jgi:hypothetical protein
MCGDQAIVQPFTLPQRLLRAVKARMNRSGLFTIAHIGRAQRSVHPRH